jgi:hypothetical protein
VTSNNEEHANGVIRIYDGVYYMVVNYMMWMLKKVQCRILWMLKYNVELDIRNNIYIMGG